MNTAFITIFTRIKIFLINAIFVNVTVFRMFYDSAIFAAAIAFMANSVIQIVNTNRAIKAARGSKFLAVGINQTQPPNLNMLLITNIIVLKNDVQHMLWTKYLKREN